MRVILMLLIAVSIIGCSKKEEQSYRTSNNEIPVQKLFEYDGCTTYRFFDERSHYYTRCGSDRVTSSDDFSTSCGKNCNRTISNEIQTIVSGVDNGW